MGGGGYISPYRISFTTQTCGSCSYHHYTEESKSKRMQLQHWVDLSKMKWKVKLLVEQNLLHRKLPLSFLTKLLRSREVPGSNLGPETGYPDGEFSCFSLVTPEMWHISTYNCITTFYSTHSATDYNLTPIPSLHTVKSTLLRSSFSQS